MSTLTKTIKLFAVSISASFIIANSSLVIAQTIKSKVAKDWPDSRYIVHDDGTVTDSITKLMWKVCSEGQTWSAGDGTPSCTGSATSYTWKTALESVNDVNGVNSGDGFAKYRDWRVPNLKELESLVARDRYNPTINVTIFPDTPREGFWSSSPYAFSGLYAWSVNFDKSGLDRSSRDSKYRLRLVRSTQ